MRFLVDECTGPTVAAWLRQQEHDVFSVFDEARGMNGVLKRLLGTYPDRLPDSFVVVTESQVRFGRNV